MAIIGSWILNIAQQLRSNDDVPKLFQKVGILGPTKARMKSALRRWTLEAIRPAQSVPLTEQELCIWATRPLEEGPSRLRERGGFLRDLGFRMGP